MMPRSRRRLLLVGGAGRMGRRLAPFFRRRGLDVRIADPAGPLPGYRSAPLDEARDADVVVVAASLTHVRDALEAVLAREPRGLVFDIASVKASVAAALAGAVGRGVAAASVHPMFGPLVRTFRGANLIVCDAGDAGAARRARRLFEGVGLRIRTLSLSEHDAWVARSMGLAHLVALAAGSTLARSGVDIESLDGVASTSFRRLLALVLPILEQAPELTQGIQRGNPEARAVAELLSREVDAWREAAFSGDPARFRARLEKARTLLPRR